MPYHFIYILFLGPCMLFGTTRGLLCFLNIWRCRCISVLAPSLDFCPWLRWGPAAGAPWVEAWCWLCLGGRVWLQLYGRHNFLAVYNTRIFFYIIDIWIKSMLMYLIYISISLSVQGIHAYEHVNTWTRVYVTATDDVALSWGYICCKTDFVTLTWKLEANSLGGHPSNLLQKAHLTCHQSVCTSTKRALCIQHDALWFHAMQHMYYIYIHICIIYTYIYVCVIVIQFKILTYIYTHTSI